MHLTSFQFIKILRSLQHNSRRAAEVEKKFFPGGLNGRMIKFPKKEKQKLATLRVIIKHFDKKKQYSEKEINEILKSIYEDYVTLRPI